MTDLNKLLREKLEAAKDDFADASTYTIRPGSVISVEAGGSAGNYVWSGNSNNINPTRWHALDEARDNIAKLDYILQRIVPNYDELVAQYKAVKDIEEAGK